MRRILSTVGLVLTMSVATPALAGDAAAGKAKSAVCMACHGANGISASPLWPNLAGQKDAYLVKQMKYFRDGRRADPTMSAMAKPLSDEDIANLAAYYSSLPTK
ncbi:MAG: cytochrome c [Gammaproteobacteria bacterium]|nr:cytochrome c [Gammaproteobacteria bacterium]